MINCVTLRHKRKIMADYKFYMTTVLQDPDGTRRKIRKYDIEGYFKGLKYKSLTGANAYGKPKGVYSESFAEEEGSRVFLDYPNDNRAQTDVTLTLYFLDPNKWGGNRSETTPYARMCGQYHSFVKAFRNRYVIWNDTARNRYMLLYMEEAPSISADKLKGLQYIEAQFKFKNVYGRSYATEEEIVL